MSDEQLLFDIGVSTESLAESFVKITAKASSAFSLIEARGQDASKKLTASFGNVGGNSAFSQLAKGMATAEAGAGKLGVKLESIRATMAKTALLQKVQAAGGVSAFASTIADAASPALFAGGAAFLGFEALKMSLDAIIAGSKAAEAELAKLVKIGTDSRDLGVDTEFFQRFTEGSKKLGLEATDLTGILTKLKEASTVSLGTGDTLDPKSSAQDAIKAHIDAGNLNKGDADKFDAAGSQEERLKAALSLLSELQAKGAQLAKFDVADKVLGSDFAGKLREDDGLLARLQARIADIAAGKGAEVVPPDQIERAKELDAELESLNQRVIAAMTGYHNDVRSWQQEELNSTLQLKEYWVEIVEVFGKLYSWADSIGKTISSWGNASFFAQVTKMLDAAGMLSEGNGVHMFRDKAGNITTLSNARKEGTEPTAPGETLPPLVVTKPKGDTSKPLPEKDKGGKEKEEPNDAVQNLLDETGKSVAILEAEAKTQGLSNKAKQEAIDLAKLKAAADREDRTATADETAQMLRYADAAAAAKDKVADFNKKQEQAKELAGYIGTEFESSIEKMVTGAGKLTDVLKSVVASLEQAALKALILGEGPLAGLFGTAAPAGATGAASIGGLFGGLSKMLGFAEGGQISGPGTGTSDSIVARVSHGEYIVNAAATKANLPLLHAINSGALPKFATGGMVGSIATPSLGSSMGGGSKSELHSHITVQGGGSSDAKQNAALAQEIAGRIEPMMRGIANKEIQNQMRSGNLLAGIGGR